MQEFEFLQSVYVCNAVRHTARLPTNVKTTYMQRVVFGDQEIYPTGHRCLLVWL